MEKRNADKNGDVGNFYLMLFVFLWFLFYVSVEKTGCHNENDLCTLTYILV